MSPKAGVVLDPADLDVLAAADAVGEVASPAYGRTWADALGDARLAAVDTFLAAPLTFAA